MSNEEEQTIPLSEEVVSVGKKSITRAKVRIATTTRERLVPVEQELVREEVEIERVPIGKPVEVVPEPRQEGDVLIVPVVEEELIVTKRLVLREELRISKRVTKRTEHMTVPIRTQEAVVDRDEPPHQQQLPTEEQS
jgi:uncharacterized protein (TIGR02271 family)